MNQPLHKFQREVHNENHSLRNHLLSILKDSEVVSLVSILLPKLPLYANLRNGCWYSNKFSGTCYFKSTDGHDHQWQFSKTRLNLNVAITAAENSGIIIVDSTRRGKTFPDSMYSTIPIWSSIINKIVFPQRCLAFNAPPWMPKSVVSQIVHEVLPQLEKSISPGLVDLIRSTLVGKLVSPLRPLWVFPNADGDLEWLGEESEAIFDICCREAPVVTEVLEEVNDTSRERGPETSDAIECTPLVLLSCSGDVSEAVHSSAHSWFYVKGAGDDEEHWSRGLSPSLFWSNIDSILQENNAVQLESLVNEIVGDVQLKKIDVEMKKNDTQDLLQSEKNELLSTIVSVGSKGTEVLVLYFNHLIFIL